MTVAHSVHLWCRSLGAVYWVVLVAAAAVFTAAVGYWLVGSLPVAVGGVAVIVAAGVLVWIAPVLPHVAAAVSALVLAGLGSSLAVVYAAAPGQPFSPPEVALRFTAWSLLLTIIAYRLGGVMWLRLVCALVMLVIPGLFVVSYIPDVGVLAAYLISGVGVGVPSVRARWRHRRRNRVNVQVGA